MDFDLDQLEQTGTQFSRTAKQPKRLFNIVLIWEGCRLPREHNILTAPFNAETDIDLSSLASRGGGWSGAGFIVLG